MANRELTATEQAKIRAQAGRPPPRPVVPPNQRLDMQGGTPAAPVGQDPNVVDPDAAPTGVSPAELLQQSGTAPMVDERGQARPREQIEADMKAYREAVQRANAEKSAEKESEKKDEVEEQKEDESWWNWQESDVLANSARRKKIEATLKPMRVEDLLLHNEVKQTIVTIPPKDGEEYGLEFEFRSISVDEDLAVKRIMSGFRGSDQYISDRYAIMNLVCGLFRVNDRILPSHLNDEGKFDEDLYTAKMAIVRKWPYNLVQDLVNNWAWFEDRVRKLFVVEDLGNG